MTDPQHPPSPAQEPSLPVVGHILRRKRDGFVRGLYPSPRTEEDYEYAKIDGDEYLALADHAAAIAALRSAQQRAEAAEADARRWRWLRSNQDSAMCLMVNVRSDDSKGLDRLADAAFSQEPTP